MNVRTLTEQILRKMSHIGRWQFNFILNLFPLLLAMRGRDNFCNMARWGDYQESTYRTNYDRSFDWLEWNMLLARQSLSHELAIAFDPSFLPKSGKHTPGIGYFYSGCAGRELRGLELGGLAVIDQQDKTALHLEAIQTVDLQANETLLNFYARSIISRKARLQQLSCLLLVDAYFSKLPFITLMRQAGFDIVTRLRKDARLRYLYRGPHRKGRGCPKKFDGRIDVYNLRRDQVRPGAKAEDGSWIAYELVANIQAWKSNAKVVIVQELTSEGSIKGVRIIACTNLNMDGGRILWAYHSRFQIELLYRDAKQHLGLTHCQARSKEKIHFHLNASLTAVSVAKVAHYLNQQTNDKKPFSMTDIKIQYSNQLLLDQFISMFGIDPHLPKIKSVRNEIENLGKIAA